MPENGRQPDDARPEPDLSGRQLGDYQLLRRLGRGGMADVYLADQRSLRRQVAFKVLHRRLSSDEAYVRRFHNEAQAAAALVHANIVQIYEVGCLEGIHFIAQEYVAGQNLLQLINRRGALAAPLVVSILRQTAAALHKAAERGIVHRDVKPENILLTPEGEIKVADFGLARISEGGQTNLTQVGVTLGTPLYMSPEQVEGKTLDHRSDLYSLGVTAYHMLAGRVPFQGETALSVAVQHLRSDPPRLEDQRADLPEALSRIVHKLLAKSPADRFASVTELLRELRAVPVGEGEVDWNSGLDDATAAELQAGHNLRDAAQERLQELMKTESWQLHRRRSARWIVVPMAAMFVAGGAAAWMFRPRDMLSIAARNGGVITKQADSTAQYEYAVNVPGDFVRREAALQSVIDYWGQPAASPVDAQNAARARLQLGYLYADNQREPQAIKMFEQVLESDVEELHPNAHAYLANIYSRSPIRQVTRVENHLRRLVESVRTLVDKAPEEGRLIRDSAKRMLDTELQPQFEALDGAAASQAGES